MLEVPNEEYLHLKLIWNSIAFNRPEEVGCFEFIQPASVVVYDDQVFPAL